MFAREPSWIAVASAQAVLAVWLALLAIADGFPGAAGDAAVRASSAMGAAVLGVFGFVVPVILGMFPRLAPGLLGLPRPSRKASLAPAAVGAALALAALAWTFTGRPLVVAALGGLGIAGGALLALGIAGGGPGGRAGGLPVAASPPFLRASRPGNLMLRAGMAYLLAGCALLVALWLDAGFAAALGAAPTVAWPLHLLTTGFIALTAFGVGTRMFGAFAGAEAPAGPVWAIAIAGLPAPLAIAAGIARTDPRLIALGGALALVASTGFLGVVLYLFRRQRRRRKAWYLLVAASAMLVAGESLGAAFAIFPQALVLVPVHGQINTLGFAGLLIFGVLFEFSGGRAAKPDAFAPGFLIAFVWPAALALRLLGALFAAPPAALAGDLALLGSLALAARDAHPADRHRQWGGRAA